MKKLIEWNINEFNEQKEVKVQPNNLIHFSVKEKVYECWKHCVELAKKDKKNEEQLLVRMMDNYLATAEGRAVGEKGLEL